MTKIIHCIKVGPSSELGDFELSCVNSWKKTYPDFTIKYWTDKQILPLIEDCKYALSCYKNKKFAYVGDYARLKILYEEGGLYMDTDVFCVSRIPDSCFEKSFTSWDAGFGTYWTQNGTCLYAASPNEAFFGQMVKYYKGFDEYPTYVADNTVIEHFIRKESKLDWSNRMTCQLTNQDIGPMNVYNCAQFGAFDYVQNLMWNVGDDVPVYLVHSRTKSWAGYVYEGVYLYYAFIDKDTDMKALYNAVHYFNNMKNNPNCKTILVLGLNTVSSSINWFSKWLKLNLGKEKDYLIAPLGDGLDDEELNAAFADFVSKRYNKIKFCRDIMDGKFTGELNV